jgi:catechol 2,3-dioxygenase-like lactoylglutathione lyase family enzyme
MTVHRVMPILTVSDIEASGDAYVRVLGLREVMNHGWIVTLADDEHRHQVSLMTKDATAPRRRRCRLPGRGGAFDGSSTLTRPATS